MVARPYNVGVRCPLCGSGKARRACPALGKQICPVCCGSKRGMEIACPADCGYLTSAQAHPPAVVVRRHERDVARITPLVQDLNRVQGELFLLFGALITSHPQEAFQTLLDEDVAAAAGALAATLDTASRGVIYEHRPATLPAERLLATFKDLLDKAGKGAALVERHAVLVLRRLEEGATASADGEPTNSRAFIELLGRVLPPLDASAADALTQPPPDTPRLIVP